MKVTPPTYPLLLTMSERGALSFDTESYDDCSVETNDVYRADYQQGPTLVADRLLAKKAVRKRRGIEETGIGWKDSNSAWVQIDPGQGHPKSLVSCSPGTAAVHHLESAEGSVLPSASHRFFWTSQLNHQDKTQSLRQWDEQAQNWTSVWTGHMKHLRHWCSAPSEDRLLFVVQPEDTVPTLWEWRPENGAATLLLTADGLQFGPIGLSPDGKRLAFVDEGEPSVRVLDLRTGEVQAKSISDAADEEDFDCFYSDPEYSAYGEPAWSPDGSRVFYTRSSFGMNGHDAYTGSALFVATADGKERVPLLGCPEDDEAVFGVEVGQLK